MPLPLRDYQQQCVADAVQFLTTSRPGAKRMYVSPCGTGKSVIEVAIQHAVPDSVIVTPRTEIINGMVEKGADRERCYTPISFRNRLLQGTVRPPTALIIDEAHHDTADTADTIRLCTGHAPTVAFTATPFRGTPQGTAALRELYGEPHYVLTLREAVQRGLCTLPHCRTEPILDDDIVEITNGEFKVHTLEAKTPWRAAADLVSRVWQTRCPTVAALPSVLSVRTLAEELQRRRVPVREVTGETPAAQRNDAFRSCVASASVLLQIQVVSEGVDLPIRRLIDLAPTMSPVRWLQQVGRAMRPGGQSEYISTNRNLLRHGYLLEGLLPCEAIAEAEAAFPTPSKRTVIRAFGLESLGKLKPCRVPLVNGVSAWAYYVTRAEDHIATQYVAIVLPHIPDPLWAVRENRHEKSAVPDTPVYVNYGTWTRCGPPQQLSGFASVKNKPVSPKQAAWWERAAEKHGLDPQAEVDAKIFAALPVLSDLKLRITT